jgi:hypothetical protein
VSRIVAWTGHRPDIFRDPALARRSVELAAQDAVAAGADAFLVGGQRGVDTWAALAALAMGVTTRLILPLHPDEFTRDWSEVDRDLLARTMRSAAEVHLAGTYTDRNRRLAEGAQQLVAVWTGLAGGGTAETIQFARQAGTAVREILLEASPAAASATGRGI